MSGSRPGQAPDELGFGDERPGLAERSRLWSKASLLPNLRRHRLAWLGTGVVVLVAGASVAYWRTRPPAELLQVRVAFAPLTPPSDEGILGVQNLYQIAPDTAAANYDVADLVPGDTVDVLGVDGPGLAATAVSGAPSRYGSVPEVTVSARFDCAQPKWWTAADGDYRVKVLRTDRYGRVRHATVALPPGDSAGWREAVQRNCLYPILAAGTFDQWTVTTDPGRSHVTLSVAVRNPADHAIFLQFGFPNAAGTSGTGGAGGTAGTSGTGAAGAVKVEAYGGAQLTTSWPASGCADYSSDLLALTGPDDPTDAVMLRVAVSALGQRSAQDSGDPYLVGLLITHALRVHLQTEINLACASLAAT
jgi:hypothetical protein